MVDLRPLGKAHIVGFSRMNDDPIAKSKISPRGEGDAPVALRVGEEVVLTEGIRCE